MQRILGGMLCVAIAVGAFTGRAHAFTSWPGSSCFFTGASASNTSIVPFATIVSNNSGNTIQVTCPLGKDAGHNTLLSWIAYLDGTAAWSKASCNVFWTDSQGTTLQAYPSTHIGEAVIGNGRAAIGSDGTQQSFNGLGGPAVLVCNMPAHSSLYSYIMTEN